MEITPLERDLGIIAVKSDVWPERDGTARWTIRHISSGTTESGTSTSLLDAYRDMEKVCQVWQRELDAEGPITTLIRPVP